MNVNSHIDFQQKKQENQASRHNTVPPKNPNKRPTIINMERSIGRMKSNDMDVIRRAK